LGETHRDAIVREVDEELGATIHDLELMATVENMFRIDGVLGHEIVFLYSGRLEPLPAVLDATLTESDGSIVPVVWRPFNDAAEARPRYPAGVLRGSAASRTSVGKDGSSGDGSFLAPRF